MACLRKDGTRKASATRKDHRWIFQSSVSAGRMTSSGSIENIIGLKCRDCHESISVFQNSGRKVVR